MNIYNNATIKVDNYVLGTTSNFYITTDYVVDMFNTFNYRYFENKLHLDTYIKVKVYPYKHVLGSVEASGQFNKSTGKCSAIVKQFSISNYFDRSEYTYCNTILHEMIHVYQYQVLNVCDGHGDSFTKKMKEINKYGWEISIKETTDEINNRGSKNQQIIDKERIKKAKKESENDVNNYILALWLPEDATSINGDRNIAFHILDKDIPDMYLARIKYALNVFNPNNHRDYYLFKISENSHIAKTLRDNGYFEKRYRLSNEFLSKKLNSRTYNSDELTFAILRRTYALPYNMFKMEEANMMLEPIDDKILPASTDTIKESIKSVNLNKRINSAEDFINVMEHDPYIDVLSAEDLGDTIEFNTIIS